MVDVPHPATRDLAVAAYEASGCKTHQQFCNLFGEAVSLRTFRGWLVGANPAAPIAQLLLREFIAGWRPGQGNPIAALRDSGHAVVVFEPAELGNAKPSTVEDLMVERGWNAIADLRGADVDELAAEANK